MMVSFVISIFQIPNLSIEILIWENLFFSSAKKYSATILFYHNSFFLSICFL